MTTTPPFSSSSRSKTNDDESPHGGDRDRRAPRSWRRHFEGWQLGAVAVAIAAAAALVAVPRPTAPDIFPLPAVDRAALRFELEREGARALAARTTPLPYEVRAVGESVRRFGLAESSGDAALADGELLRLRQRVGSAREKHSDERLRALRAVQTELFVSAARRARAAADVEAELLELGGPFMRRAGEWGWVATGRLVLSEVELRVLFQLRWLELTGLRDVAGFAPSLNAWRVYYRCLLEHPQVAGGAADAPEGGAAVRLAYVSALAKRDPEYPAALARGVLHYQRGAYDSARAELLAHLARHPTGPWALRAQNHLLASYERLREAEP